MKNNTVRAHQKGATKTTAAQVETTRTESPQQAAAETAEEKGKLQSAEQIAEKIISDFDQNDWLQVAKAMQEAAIIVRLKLKKAGLRWTPEEPDFARCVACVRGLN